MKIIISDDKLSPTASRGHMLEDEKVTVIIVDDHDWVRFSLKTGLEGNDITFVGEAKSSFEAIDLCEELHPDILLLDMYMIDENGWESIPQILEASPETKIIAMSAFAGSHMIQTALQNGASSFISKSSSLSEIREAIVVHSDD